MLRNRVDDFAYASDGKIISNSYNEFDQKMKEGFANVQKIIEAEIPSIHVFLLSNEAATCTYLFKSKFVSTSGDTVVNNGCWTFVFKKFENGWKMVQKMIHILKIKEVMNLLFSGLFNKLNEFICNAF